MNELKQEIFPSFHPPASVATNRAETNGRRYDCLLKRTSDVDTLMRKRKDNNHLMSLIKDINYLMSLIKNINYLMSLIKDINYVPSTIPSKYASPSRLEKYPQSDVQMCEGLAPLGIMEAQ